MIERFTVPARETVARARQEAIDMHHGFIGTEHLLLALLDERSGRPAGVLRAAGLTPHGVRAAIHRQVEGNALGATDAEALKAIGIDLDAVRGTVEATFGPGALRPPAPGRKGLFRKGFSMSRISKRGRKVLELALREAVHAKSNEITTDFLLLGLLREGEGLAVRIMVDAGVDLVDVRRQLIARDQAA